MDEEVLFGQHSPEAILEKVKLAENPSGSLRIYLGASPGVGKTYAMLETARRLVHNNKDVVIGLAVTHGRAETAALLAGLEVIPLKNRHYRSRTFKVVDLDAIIKRRPEVVIIDELAHSNIKGSLHKKRYADILEILSAGIDVHTTVNIQHIESINGDVQKITGIAIKETVPDYVILNAHEIAVVDLPSSELIQRLKEGKVYLGNRAAKAMNGFFKQGNLLALREITMRYAAKNIDQHILYHKSHLKITAPWPVAEKVVTLITPNLENKQLIRSAKQLADRYDAQLIALQLNGPSWCQSRNSNVDVIQHNRHYAEQLNAETITLSAANAVVVLIDYAKHNNVTHIVLEKSTSGFIEVIRYRQFIRKLLKYSKGINIHIVDTLINVKKKHRKKYHPYRERVHSSTPLLSYMYSAAVIAAVLIGLSMLSSKITLITGGLAVLFTIVVSAYRWGRLPALLTATIGFIYCDMLLISPLYSLKIFGLPSLLTFIILITVSLFVGLLTASLRAQIDMSNKRQKITQTMYQFTRAITQATNMNELLDEIGLFITQYFSCQVVLFIAKGDKLVQQNSNHLTQSLSSKVKAAAQWVWKNKKECGQGTDTLSNLQWYLTPLKSADKYCGLLGIKIGSRKELLCADDFNLFQNIVYQSSASIAKLMLEDAQNTSRLMAERETLRATLLSSVSHDLRTPLVSIQGAISGILSYGKQYDAATQHKLLRVAHEETERLNRYINNLVQMMKLDSGALTLNCCLTEIDKVVTNALERTKSLTAEHILVITLPKGLPAVQIDPIMTEMVVINLIENAIKYSKPGSEITISVSHENDVLLLTVVDQGVGIEPDDLELIFDLFYRTKQADYYSGGSGMGLSICRGILEAENATINAYSDGIDTGAVFTLCFPIPMQLTAA